MSNKTWSLIVSGLLLAACGEPAPPTPPPPETVEEQPQTPACSVPAPTACPEPAPRYADVAAIIEQRCSSCHSPNWGGPWPLNDYAHVSDWQDTIRANLLDCTMPPPEAKIPITLEERVTILTWIRCGLPR